jgi:L-ascorbate metabolism protein UlaG (beta-lactamase superfamily)
LEKTDARLVASNRVCDFVNKKIPAQRLIRIEPHEKVTIGLLTLSALKAQHRHGLEGLGGDILGLLAYKKYIPCGTNMSYLISVNGKTIFHSGDTHIIKGVHNPDVAFLSMGGFRTLNEEEAVDVIREMCPTIAIPIHYKWHDTGEKIVENVKERVDREKIDVHFKEMAYGEVLEI